MRTGSILFLLGIALLLQFPCLPPAKSVLLLPVAGILLFKYPRLRWPAWFLCGFLWALFRADLILSENLDKQLEGMPLITEGRVVSLPVNRGTLVRFDFKIDSMTDAKGRNYAAPGKIRLNWYRDYPQLEPGDHWRLTVKLKRPYGFMNPGGFDYEGFLFQEGIGATGYVLNRGVNTRLSVNNGFNINRIRFRLRNNLETLLQGKPVGPLIAALVTGDRSAITPSQWRILNRTGTNHLLAISGLHIGLVAGFVFLITRWLWPLTGGLWFTISGLRIAAACSFIGALVYAALAGFSIPTQRALIMLGIILLLGISGRNTRSSNIISLALLLILIIDPFSLLSTGFWLSFTAIVAILYGMTCRTGYGGFWWRWGRVQWFIAVGLLPLLVMSYQQVPLLGIAANFIAVPWVSMVTVPLVLSGVCVTWLHEGLGTAILILGADSLELLWGFLKLISEIEPGVVQLSSPSLAGVIAAMFGAFILLMPRGLPGRLLGIVWMLPALIPLHTDSNVQQFRFILLDVGQGLAAVVHTRHHTLLFDTGPRYSDRFDAGQDVILPYLNSKGINRIDRVIASHGDNDHIGGLPQLLANIQISDLYSSVPEKIRNFRTARCRTGDHWEWDGVTFTMLSPESASDLSGNNLSCVLQVAAGRHSLLLTGDIERRAEQNIVSLHPNTLKSEVLVAPHHGSNTSSSPEFIQAVQPRYVLFPVGYRNRFNFPKQDIIDRYKAVGAIPLDTASSGAIEILFEEKGLKITQYRQRMRRFWNSEY